jgi:hypothetical protein
MTTSPDARTPSADDAAVDSIDREAAEIDPRSEDAAEKIEELIEHADRLGLDATQPIEGDHEAPSDDEPEVLPG